MLEIWMAPLGPHKREFDEPAPVTIPTEWPTEAPVETPAKPVPVSVPA